MTITSSQYLLEMSQVQTYLQAQLPSGVIVLRVEKFVDLHNRVVSWAVHVHIGSTNVPAVITAVSTRPDGILPLEEIINKANLLGA